MSKLIFNDGFEWELISREEAELLYKNFDVYGIDPESQTEGKIECIEDLDARPLLAIEGQQMLTYFYKWGEFQNIEVINKIDLPLIKLTDEQLEGFNIHPKHEEFSFYAVSFDIHEDNDGISVKRAFAIKPESND